MSCPRFFAASPIPHIPPPPHSFTLDARAAAHVRVLRLREGDAITLFDGHGGEWQALINAIGKRDVAVTLTQHQAIERESPLSITLVQALATGDKMDWIIQKATELGATAIQPVQTQRATAKLNAERAEKRAEHWHGVAIAACEQCGRNRIPSIHHVMDFSDWLAAPFAGFRLLLQPGAPGLDTVSADQHTALIIGPEGGFTEDEIRAAQRAGATAVSFGPRVMRTETAGIALLAAMQAIAGDGTQGARC
jgi:16S rRNA (uracil1498-N3)-methyltransferase